MKKKILLGMAGLCLATSAMAKPVEIKVDPQEGTNVFTGGQKGSIAVNGKLVSNKPAVKYIVFATSDEGKTQQDELKLTNFVICESDALGGEKPGFTGANPKVMVRRLEGNEIKPLSAGEKVLLSLENKTVSQASSEVKKEGERVRIEPLALLSHDMLDELVGNLNKLGIGNYHIDEVGNIARDSDKTAYHAVKMVAFNNIGQGDISIENCEQSSKPRMDKHEEIDTIESFLAVGKDIAGNCVLRVEVQ